MITATGRAVYVDDKGNEVGIRSAVVELCDADPSGCSSMGTRTTDADGNFVVSGKGGDGPWDLPDPTVRVWAQSVAGKAMTSGWPQKTYCFETATIHNSATGRPSGLTRSPPTPGASCYRSGAVPRRRTGGWQLHNNLVEAWAFTNGFSSSVPGRSPAPVEIRWPSGSNDYDNSVIGIAPGSVLGSEQIVWHEYGHHIMNNHGRADAEGIVCERQLRPSERHWPIALAAGERTDPLH